MSKRPPTCDDKAYELLSRRSHFSLELRRKLEQRGYEEAEIEATLAKLTASGYLEDRATAEQYVTGRLRRGGIGPLKLLAELRQRGVGEIDARDVVEAQVEDETELARRAAEKWRSARGHRASVASLARHLQSAGFHGHLVAEQVRSFQEEQRRADPEEQGFR